MLCGRGGDNNNNYCFDSGVHVPQWVHVSVCYCRSKAKIPVISLTKLIEREKNRLPPAPVSVSAVRGQVSNEGKVQSLTHLENQQRTVELVNSSAPDYFYDDIAWLRHWWLSKVMIVYYPLIVILFLQVYPAQLLLYNMYLILSEITFITSLTSKK